MISSPLVLRLFGEKYRDPLRIKQSIMVNNMIFLCVYGQRQVPPRHYSTASWLYPRIKGEGMVGAGVGGGDAV